MKIDRLIGILSILLKQEKATAPYLAEKFEVSRRTINRDIEDLCKAGIPIVTIQGKNGGISIMEGYKIDSTLLTSSDMQAILAGLRSLDSVSGNNRYSTLMEKLSLGAANVLTSGEHILIDLSSWYKESLSPKIELINKSIETGEMLTFNYFSPKGESFRTVEPYYLVFRWSSWYLWGKCTLKNDFRLFKLNRMTDLKSGEKFQKETPPMPDINNEKLFPPLYRVEAIFDERHKWRLIDDYGAESFKTLENGKLYFSFDFTDEDIILCWILSFKTGVELLKPHHIREKLKNIGNYLNEKYSDT